MSPRRLAAVAAAAALMVALTAVQASAAPALRSPGLRGVAKKVAVKAATAPPPLELSATGTRPDILVDAAGTAHVAWDESSPGAPDTTVYCRVPRGARACDVVQRLVPPGADQYSQDANGPEVVAVNDQLVVLSHRYPQGVVKPGDDRSEDDNTLWLWSSDDGGQSFGQAAVVGTGSIGGGAAAYGPSSNPSIGGVTGIVTGGTTFTGVQGGRFTFRGGLLAAGDFVNGRIAVRDGVPSVAYADIGLTSTFVRTWTGQGDPNDPATWSPPQQFPGTDPDIAVAGGRLLVLNEDSAGRLFLRDAAGGAAVRISTGSAATGLALGHPDGRVSLVWNGSEGGSRGLFLRSRVTPGVAPRGAPSLISATGGIFPEASATDDGGGAVVTEDGKRILLTQFGSRAPTGRPGLGGRAGGGSLGPDVAVACQQVRIGPIQAELQDGCFLSAATGRAKVSAGTLRLNGLEIIPDAGVQVIIDPAARAIRSTGTVTVMLRAPGIPDITLFRGSIQIDAKGKSVGSSLISWTDGLFKPNLLGFPLAGDIDVRLTNGGVRIPVSVQLPKAFGNVRGAAELIADNRRGLVVDSLDFSADGVPLGPVMLRRLAVQYRANGGTTTGDCLRPRTSGASALPNEWAGVFELQLPPPNVGPGVCGSIRFGGGAFRAASFRIDLPYPGIVLFPGVSMTSLGGGLSLTPAEITAGATFGIIPAGANAALVRLDARIDARISDPFTLKGSATVTTAGVTIGDGTFTLSTDGYVALALNAGPSIGPIEVKARIAGFADGPRREFALGASGSVCIGDVCAPDAEAVVSTKGIAVCLPTFPRGAGYSWGAPLIGGVKIWPVSCYASDYQVSDTRQAAFGDAVAEGGASVPPGAPDVTFRVTGEGGVPAVDLIGPSGAPVAPGGTVADPAGVLYLSVTSPPPGRWTVRARPGSPLIGEVSTSRSVAPPKVASARVTGARLKRVLRYRATLGEGQGITFAERGRAGVRILGPAKAGAGRIGFAPGPGPGGPREIVALLSQNGLVVQEVVVTRYTAPPPPRLGRATTLRLRRSGTRAVATWRPGAAATAQRVQAVIAGGQRVNRIVGGRTNRAVIPGVNGRRVAATVTAIARDGHAGRPARASLAAVRRR
jgi:hypothetical protein